MYVTNVTVLRGDRGLTEVTSYDILEAVLGVHGLVNGKSSERLKVLQKIEHILHLHNLTIFNLYFCQ